jgi:hypothetical protein
MPSFVPKLDIDSVSAIKSVAVTIDGKPAANFTEAPFSGPVRVPRTLDTASRHIVTVTVTDEYFNTATASVSVRLENDTGAPSLSFFSPSEGEIIKKGESVSIRVVADDDAGIDRVQFFLDSTLLTTKRDTPYSFDYKLDVPAGSHILKAVAEDAAGNEGETSVSVTVE